MVGMVGMVFYSPFTGVRLTAKYDATKSMPIIPSIPKTKAGIDVNQSAGAIPRLD
jgi:hypothetical protein